VCRQMNETGRGAQCNRAIMLITDGAPDTYEDIFDKYNWPNKDVRLSAFLRCRRILFSCFLFTYTIERRQRCLTPVAIILLTFFFFSLPCVHAYIVVILSSLLAVFNTCMFYCLAIAF